MPIENTGQVSVGHGQKQHQFSIKTVLSILMPACIFTVNEYTTRVWEKKHCVCQMEFDGSVKT
jgi:hypothetical protein